MAWLRACLLLLSACVCLAVEDAWMVKVSNNIYGMPWSAVQNLTDRKSPTFRESETYFCGIIKQIFQEDPVLGNPVKQRFRVCLIDSFNKSSRSVDAPVSFTYSMVFSGTDPIPKAVLDAMFIANTETYSFGDKVWTLIGDWLISRYDFQMSRVNMTDYTSTSTGDTQLQAGATVDTETVLDIELELVNMTLTPALEDPSSQEFKTTSSSFCEGVSGLLQNRFSYKGCLVTALVNNTVDGSLSARVQLTFGLDGEVFPALVVSVVVETAQRPANTTNTLLIGPYMVSEGSLLRNIPRGRASPMVSNRAGDVADKPDGNPCARTKNQALLPDPVDPSAYIICHLGVAYQYQCDQNRIFDAKKDKCVIVV